MRSATLHIFKKDVRASWLSLLILWLGVAVADLSLGTLYLAEYAAFLQVAIWVYAAYILWDRVHADNTLNPDTSWWVSRPLASTPIVHAKILYAAALVLFPPFLSRVVLCLALGYGWRDAWTTAVLGCLPFMLIAVFFLGKPVARHAHVIHRIFWPSAGACFLIIAGSMFIHPPQRRAPVHCMKHPGGTPALAEVAKMPDPNLILPLPDDILVSESSVDGIFRQNNTKYKFVSGFQSCVSSNGRVSPNVWFWHLRAQPIHADLRAQRQVISIPQTTRLSKVVLDAEGNKNTVGVPEDGGDLQGAVSHVATDMRFKLARKHVFWQGNVEVGKRMLADGIACALSETGDGKLKVRFQAATTKGTLSSFAFHRAFRSGSAFVFSTRDGTNDILFTTDFQYTSYGFPGVTQQYEFEMPDPRPFLPEGKPLKLIVYEAVPIYGNPYDQKKNFNNWTWRFPRLAELESLMDESMSLSMSGTVSDQSERPSGSETVESTVYANPALAEQLAPLLRVGVDREEAWEWSERQCKKYFDPSRKEDVATLLALLERAPRLFTWLPPENREAGKQVLAICIRQRPVAKPSSMLAVAEEAGLATDEFAEDLAWCFIHSDYAESIHAGRSFGGFFRRCPISRLNLIPEKYRAAAWDETWQRFRFEVVYDWIPRGRNGYLMEAIRRDSPQAYAVTTLYFRHKLVEQRRDLSKRNNPEPTSEMVIAQLLKKKTVWIDFLQQHCQGPEDPEAFLRWFLNNGFQLDK